MPRRGVTFLPDAYYHLYNRGNNRKRIFYERENYLFFLRQMRSYLLPATEIIAYCLMPNHYHLLAKVKDKARQAKIQQIPDVSRAMMRLAVSYTKAMNKKYNRKGVLFQGSFQAKQVLDDDHLIQLSAYIHLNPVWAGLVAGPDQWEFSSYREYVGQRRDSLPSPEAVLVQFTCPQAYREFVSGYANGGEGQLGELALE